MALQRHRGIKDAFRHATPWAAIGGILMGYGAILPSPANYIVSGIATAFLIMGVIIKSPSDGETTKE